MLCLGSQEGLEVKQQVQAVREETVKQEQEKREVVVAQVSSFLGFFILVFELSGIG